MTRKKKKLEPVGVYQIIFDKPLEVKPDEELRFECTLRDNHFIKVKTSVIKRRKKKKK